MQRSSHSQEASSSPHINTSDAAGLWNYLPHLLQEARGSLTLRTGEWKMSIGRRLHLHRIEYAGKRQVLEGTVLVSGGITRQEARDLVGSFSEPGDPPAVKGPPDASAKPKPRNSAKPAIARPARSS